MFILPFTNLHELNLDWIIQAIKSQEDRLTQFVSLNTIKYANPFQWNIASQYAINTLVIDPQNGTAYLSVQPVPSGVQITNTDYWTPVFTLQNFTDALKAAITNFPQQEDGQAATQEIPANSVFFVGDILCTNAATIPTSSLVVFGTNCTQVDVVGLLSDAVSAEATAREQADTALGQRITQEETARQQLGQQISEETTARQQADTQLGQQISEETTARQQADTQLGQRITKETTAREQADTQLGQQISALDAQTLSGAKIITPQMYGAVGDGVTDDTDAFITAIQDAYDNGYTLYIPATGNLDVPAGYNGYVLSRTLNITKPMTILADPLSVLNWKNMTTEPKQSGTDPTTGAILYSSGVGINIDYGNYANHKGTYRFGIIQGCKNYTYPGASAPSGHYGTAVRIANGDLVNFYAKYISYWDTGLYIQANVNFTANETISFDVMDDCQNGVHFNTTGPNYIEGVNLTFNTIGLCRFGIIFTANNSTAGIHGINIRGAEIWTEYTNGSCLYTMTVPNILYNSNITVQELYNICNPSTSKEGIGTAYYGPFISGTGNQCFKATNTTIKCGCSVSNNAQYAERAGIGLDGSISFTNLIEQFANNYSTAYTPMSTKSGVFNSGVIPLANYMYVHFTLGSTLSAGSTTSFYVQMQNAISGGSMRPYIMPLNGYPVVMSVTDVSDYTDYQVYKIDLLAVTDQSSGADFYAIVGNGN